MTTVIVCIYLIVGVLVAFGLYISIPGITKENYWEIESGFETFTILCVIAVTWPFWLGLILYERWRV